MSKHIVGTDMSDPKVLNYWSTLSQVDPERFERERKTVIEEFISQAPPEKQFQLRQTQGIIEEARAKEKDPVVFCEKLLFAADKSLAAQMKLAVDLQEVLIDQSTDEVLSKSGVVKTEAEILGLFKKT